MNIVPSNQQSEQSPFDAIRHEDEQGNEYWTATELLALLGYKTWKRQKETVERAIISCQNNKADSALHFVEVVQMAQIGDSEAYREVIRDYKLSRYGAYLTAMNGDPRKPKVAAAQSYFAVKTHESETQIPALLQHIQSQGQQLAELKQDMATIKAVLARVLPTETPEADKPHLVVLPPKPEPPKSSLTVEERLFLSDPWKARKDPNWFVKSGFARAAAENKQYEKDVEAWKEECRRIVAQARVKGDCQIIS
ncbi:MAG: hypothetical protein F6K31_25720 [Symploca sp. SIO2G7]|nr:hypothetical protein [Symploca sp. SIO2G7]